MSSNQDAKIASIRLCVGHREPMRVVESANVIDGFGIEGDRHATSEGVKTVRQVLLMDAETLDSLGLSHGEVRENVTTSGIDLYGLAEGSRLAFGDQVVLQISGHCVPCSRMDEIRPGLQRELEGKRGMISSVVHGGTISVGDPIRVVQAAKA